MTLEPTGVEIRFGRAQLENSYGPDTSDLPQTLSIHYYTENGYVLSDTDTCTTFNSDNITLTDMSLGAGKTDVKAAVSGDFFDEMPKGETRKIILTAPTTAPSNVNTGQVEVIYTISDWLRYDWGYDDEGSGWFAMMTTLVLLQPLAFTAGMIVLFISVKFLGKRIDLISEPEQFFKMI